MLSSFNGGNARNYYEMFIIENADIFQNIIIEIIRQHNDFTAETERMCSEGIMKSLTVLLKSAPSKMFHVTMIPEFVQIIVSYSEWKNLKPSCSGETALLSKQYRSGGHEDIILK